MAANNKGMVINTLFHHIDEEWLRQAHQKVRKDGATGIDAVSGGEYAKNLEANLSDLYQRLKEKRYKAPMIRRVRIPKAEGGVRSIGITTFEDKIVQRAIVMAMEAVYEQDFLDCSYGCRPGRSQHQALGAIRRQCQEINVQWILDADIKSYFDTIPHAQLQEIIKQRVNDGNLVRLIGKWLKTGVADLGQIEYPEVGTPQGGVISPLLANIYLHTVLDKWFATEVQPRLSGRTFLVRYVDDFVIGFELESDARRVYEVLPKRFEKYGLKIHPDKTRLRKFHEPREDDDENDTFNFLGFTHHWGRTQRGGWTIKRKTERKRLKRSLKAVWKWCKEHRHDSVPQQYKRLRSKLKGHYQYYGVRSNYAALHKVWRRAEEAWRYWLSRRSWHSAISWSQWHRFRQRYPLPMPCIVHASSV